MPKQNILKNTICFFTSLLFYLSLCLSSFLVPIIFLIPSFIFICNKLADYGAKIWAKSIIFFLETICGFTYKIINQQNRL
jgi:hypothetical protein